MQDRLDHWSGGKVSRFGGEGEEFAAFLAPLVHAVKGFEERSYRRIEVDVENGNARVWRFEPDQRPRYLVYFTPPSPFIPSAEHAWIFIVDGNGSVVSDANFDTGWRMHAVSAEYVTVPWLADKVLIQRMRPVINGAGPETIYMAFDGLVPHVVRIEDHTGKVRPMDYFAPNWVVGPPYHPKSLDELVSVVKGASEIKRLEVLVWLGGHHSVAGSSRPNPRGEPVSDQQIYALAIKSKALRDVLTTLKSSANAYERELAANIPFGE